MSNTQFAFLKQSQLPSREALQTSIDSLGFDLQLDPELNLIEDSGFSPCVLHGTPNVGFELFTQPASEVTDGDEEFESLAGDNDLCIAMVWRSSMKDLACVMIVSCALAKDFGAVISYEGEPPEPLEKMLAGTPEIIQGALGGP